MKGQMVTKVIAGTMIALSLWGCGETQPSGQEPAASTAQESTEPMESMEPSASSAKAGAEKADGGHHGHGGHDHGVMEPFVIPEGEPVPTVALAVKADPVAGWNVKVDADNFTFAPEELETPGDWNAGHAHLYLNGKKVARLYGPWFHLTGVEPGEHLLRVTLNTNDHRDLKAGEVLVEASTEFTVPEAE